MVDIVHPTVFPLPDSFEPSPGGGRPLLLKILTQFLVMCSLLLHGLAGSERGLLSVIGYRKEPDASVDPDDFRIRRPCGRIFRLQGDRDMEEELPVPEDQLGGPELCSFRERPLHGVCPEGQFDPSLQRVDAEKTVPVLLKEGIVPVPYQIQLGLTENGNDGPGSPLILPELLRMFLLAGPDGLAGCSHSLNDAFRHLGTEAEGLPQIPVYGLMDPARTQRDIFCVDPLRGIGTGVRIGPHGRQEDLTLTFVRQDLQFGSKGLLQGTYSFRYSLTARSYHDHCPI